MNLHIIWKFLRVLDIDGEETDFIPTTQKLPGWAVNHIPPEGSQGSYGNGKTEFQDLSRTIPGLFSFFQGLNFFPILYKTTRKSTFSSRNRQSEKAHSFSLILIPVIKTGTTAQIE